MSHPVCNMMYTNLYGLRRGFCAVISATSYELAARNNVSGREGDHVDVGVCWDVMYTSHNNLVICPIYLDGKMYLTYCGDEITISSDMIGSARSCLSLRNPLFFINFNSFLEAHNNKKYVNVHRNAFWYSYKLYKIR